MNHPQPTNRKGQRRQPSSETNVMTATTTPDTTSVTVGKSGAFARCGYQGARPVGQTVCRKLSDRVERVRRFIDGRQFVGLEQRLARALGDVYAMDANSDSASRVVSQPGTTATVSAALKRPTIEQEQCQRQCD